MPDFMQKWGEYTARFEETLKKFCAGLDDCRPQILAESLRYSLNIGGKRIRPTLVYATGELLGVPCEAVEKFALALELIHTYSLIHDDLPEMDNDSFRRGKPSNHIVYGAGNAVLAGDGLLNCAFEILLEECAKGEARISAARFIAKSAGVYGMIAGQSADLLHENDKGADDGVLQFIYENKTGALITASVVAPSILCGGKYYSELSAFGRELGFLFQLTDDILDVEGDFGSLGKSTGKDQKEGKYTAVGLYGVENCKIQADLIASKCAGILDGIEGDISFLKDLVYFVRTRRK